MGLVRVHCRRAMNNKPLPKYRPSAAYPTEVYVTSLREVPAPEAPLDTADRVAAYWWSAIATSPEYRPDQEQFVVIFINTRRRVIGHTIVSRGIADAVTIHPRETFRSAIVANAHAIIVGHNHPSGDPLPSEADIRVTRELAKAGHLLKIEVLDHVIVGDQGKRSSLRELGYFYNV